MAARREDNDAGRRNSNQIRQQPGKLIVYKDVLTGKDMFTSSNKITTRSNGIYEVECKMVREDDSVSDAKIGGNRNADGDKSEPGKTGCDVVFQNNLDPAITLKTEKAYYGYFRGYIKDIMKYLQKNKPDRVEGFKAAANAWNGLVLDNSKNWKYFTGEEDVYDLKGMVPLLRMREDGGTPYMLFLKDGLREETMS
ncbi:translationally-controlled tumor protein homolog [Branchiostoma lanceolatum]|uniref:translationally-controlled tumor protein homolog n=1 Tax=Branchiostoma lanceolatum TaxID=7740 RepID=UPI0034542FBF